MVLAALRDIAPGEELTYDYRFSAGGAEADDEGGEGFKGAPSEGVGGNGGGGEMLACNCGAPRCRGRVSQDALPLPQPAAETLGAAPPVEPRGKRARK